MLRNSYLYEETDSLSERMFMDAYVNLQPYHSLERILRQVHPEPRPERSRRISRRAQHRLPREARK